MEQYSPLQRIAKKSRMPNVIFIMLMIYSMIQLVDALEYLGMEKSIEMEQEIANYKAERMFNTTIYLKSKFSDPPYKCGLTMDVPCNNPRLAFNYVLKPIIEHEILLHWDELISNKWKMMYTVTVYLLDNFDKHLENNCDLDLFFGRNFTTVSSSVSIQIVFESYGPRIFTYKCSSRNKSWFSSTSTSKVNFISAINIHQVSLQSLSQDLSFVTYSELVNVVINSQKLHIYNSTLTSCEFKLRNMNGITLDECLLKGMIGYINTTPNVKLLNCVILQDSDTSSSMVWTILNIDHLQMINTIFIDSMPSKSVLKLSSIQRTEIIGCKFISSKDIQPFAKQQIFLIYAEMILNIKVDSSTVSNLRRGWISLKYTSEVSISQTSIIGNTASRTRVLFVERVNEFTFENCSVKNNTGGVIYLLDASNSKVVNSTFEDNQISNDNGGSLFVDAGLFVVLNSIFNSNRAINGSGGAIAISDSTMISIDRSAFSFNVATRSGAAVAMVNSSLNSIDAHSHVSYSRFTDNKLIHTINIDSTYCHSFYSCEGSGGALSLRTISTLKGVNASGNYAVWGGAIFTMSGDKMDSLTKLDTYVEGNSADIAGGGIFVLSGYGTYSGINVQNNSAGFYGDNIASAIEYLYTVQTTYYGLDGRYLFALNNSATLNLYLGQYAFIEILRAADHFGNLITIFKEKIEPFMNSSLLIPACEYTPIEKGINVSFHELSSQTSVSSKFTMYLKITSKSIPIVVVINSCPHGYSLQEGVCSPSFPMEALISSSVVGVLLALITGIIIGLLITFAFRKLWKIKDKLNRLKKIEKAEEDIEKRLLKSEFNKNYLTYAINTDPNESILKKHKKAMNFLINSDDLKIEKKIGEGSYGSIFLAKCWETTNVAIKSFHQKSNDEENNEEEFEREVSMLVNLRNPYIVTFYGVCITESKRFMVVEYCERGSLEKIINDCRNGKDFLTLSQKIQILLDISSGMKYLHGLKPKLIHRDLKPANVLINAVGQAKVCDFGLSKIVSTNSMKQSIFTTTIGTLFYMAPETSMGEVHENFEDRDLLTKIDVFSFSVIMYELFFEENPYLNDDSKKIHFFSNGKSLKLGLNNSNSGLNIIFRVAKEGLRPLIPFENRHELAQWADFYLFNNYTNLMEDQKKLILDGVDLFVGLMEKCWAQNPAIRPKFSEIFNDLKKIKKLFQQ